LFKLNIRTTGFACCLILLLLWFPWALNSASLVWDSAGGVGELGQLNIGSADSPSASSSYINGDHYSKDGFLGRFVYEGPATDLEFTNIGSVPSGGGSSFYYTKTTDTNRWRRYFMVASLVAFDHAENRIVIRQSTSAQNTIIENSNDKVVLTNGAGTDEYITSDPTYAGGYNAQGVFGNGSTYKYVYPYKVYWIDLTVIRSSNTNSLNNGAYESQIRIADTRNGISMSLSLGGYRGSTTSNPEQFSFSINRVCPDSVPFGELALKNSSANSYLVGYVTYQSVERRANVRFASNYAGDQVNFLFRNVAFPTDTIPYQVGFKSITPSANIATISSASNSFASTTSRVAVTSTIYGETENQYLLTGEIRIWVNSSITEFSPPSGAYTTNIYCILTMV
jgi:hypothetical protein